MKLPVVAFANQKGGTGKTSCTLGLTSAASAQGQRVLLIDMDPQANLTSAVAPEFDPQHEDSRTVGDLLAGGAAQPIDPFVTTTKWDNVELIAAELDQASIDASQELPTVLGDCLAASDLSTYELILIDCPPSVGRLMMNALVAATDVVLVTDAAADGLRGVANIETSIGKIRRLNPQLNIAGIIVNKYSRNGEQDFREQEIRGRYGDLVLEPHVTNRVALAEAHALSTPIHRHPGEGARVLADTFNQIHAQLSARLAA